MTVKKLLVLNELVGKELITTDGTTLLGADDKAGVVEIIDAMEFIINHPEIKHGDIKIAFTPDEEIGRGADLFDIEGFGAELEITDSYYNMKEKIEPHIEIIELAKKSMLDIEIEHIIKPIRGGTECKIKEYYKGGTNLD